MKIFEAFFQRLKMKKLIQMILEFIYSENFEMSSFISQKNIPNDRISLHYVYVAIEVAMNLTEPVSKRDINGALDRIKSIEEKTEIDEYNKEVQLHRYLSEQNWLKKVNYIKEGKKANKKNKYSYQGSIYMSEKIGKKPCSIKEKEKWNKLTNDIEKAELNYNRVVAEVKEKEDQDSWSAAQAVFDKTVAEMNERRKTMTEEEIQEEIELAKINSEENLKRIKEILSKNKNT